MRGILGEKMSADLKVSKEAFQYAVSFSLKMHKQTWLKVKNQAAKDFGATNQKSDRNGFYQMCGRDEKTSGNEISLSYMLYVFTHALQHPIQ